MHRQVQIQQVHAREEGTNKLETMHCTQWFTKPGSDLIDIYVLLEICNEVVKKNVYNFNTQIQTSNKVVWTSVGLVDRWMNRCQ